MLLAVSSDNSLIYKRIGYALFDDNSKLVEYGTLVPTKFSDLVNLINKYKADLAIELRYLDHRPNSEIERLFTIHTALEVLTLLNRNIVYQVTPMQWQNWIRNKLKASIKDKLKPLLESLVDNKPLPDCVLYAIGIGKYVISNRDMVFSTIMYR